MRTKPVLRNPSGCWTGDTKFVFLYTDLDNATANSIYRGIGIQMVAASAEYSFSPSV